MGSPIFKGSKAMGQSLIQSHLKLWGRDVWEAWEKLSFEKKLICIIVVNHTIALITLLEVLIFKK